MTHIVLIGGGVGAGSAAKTLRDEGFDGDVTVITDEAHPPYQRPPLSKGYLAGSEGADKVIFRPRGVVRRSRHGPAHVDAGGELDPAAHKSSSMTARACTTTGAARDRRVAALTSARRGRSSGGGAPSGVSTTPTISQRSCRAAESGWSSSARAGSVWRSARPPAGSATRSRCSNATRPARASRSVPRWARSSARCTRRTASTCARR